jgi:hypothetical protein
LDEGAERWRLEEGKKERKGFGTEGWERWTSEGGLDGRAGGKDGTGGVKLAVKDG